MVTQATLPLPGILSVVVGGTALLPLEKFMKQELLTEGFKKKKNSGIFQIWSDPPTLVFAENLEKKNFHCSKMIFRQF